MNIYSSLTTICTNDPTEILLKIAVFYDRMIMNAAGWWISAILPWIALYQKTTKFVKGAKPLTLDEFAWRQELPEHGTAIRTGTERKEASL